MSFVQELRVLLRTIADTTGAQQVDEALQRTQRQATRNAREAGVEAGFAARATEFMGDKVRELASVYPEAINAAREHERTIRATSMAYGVASAQYQQYAQQLSATTGFTSDAILEAALSARTLSQNYGLSIQQTQKLISVSADLARMRGIGVAEAFERIQSAIRGEAEGAEYLGLTLNDTFLTNQAMNGSLKNTFGTMTDVQKAQVRYTEVLKQSAQFTGLAKSQGDSLDASFNRAATSTHNLAVAVGEFGKGPALAGLDALSRLADIYTQGFKGEDTGAVRFRKFLESIPGHTFPEAAAAAQAYVDKLRDVARQERDLARLRALSDSLPPVDPLADYKREQAARRRADATNRRLLELNVTDVPAHDAAQDLARLAYLDQLQAAWQDLVTAQDRQLALQREGVSLSAEEARIKLSLLPAQQQMAALQRDITEQQLRARQAALPASRALEDLRYEQQVAQLTLQQRGVPPEERAAARAALRAIGRAMPAAELAALVAGRPEQLAGRAAEDVGIQAQLLDIRGQRALADVNLAQQQNQFAQAIGAAVAQAQEQVLGQLVNQAKEPILVSVNITHEDGRVETYTELIEANQQAQLPGPIQQSGVRRGPS